MKTPSSDVWFLALSLFLATFFSYTILLLRPFNFWVEMAGATLIFGGLAAHKVRIALGLARMENKKQEIRAKRPTGTNTKQSRNPK